MRPGLVGIVAGLLVLAACAGGEEAARGEGEAADTSVFRGTTGEAPAIVPDSGVVPLRTDSAGGRLPSEPELLGPATLEGTEWVLVSLPGAPDPPEGARATLVLDDERGILHGSTGCGTFDGSYQLEGGRLRLGVTGVVPASCADALARLATDYLEALRLTGSWRLRADTLALIGEAGVVARFRP